jgi:23S rRNA pseudouridine1911/1915/1917 synthase
MEVIVVARERTGLELDEYLCLERPLLNKGFFRRLVRSGEITVNGGAVLPNHRLREGDVVILSLDELADRGDLPVEPAAPDVPVRVLFEDARVLVVDKPAGVASEPERWAPELGCMAGALLAYALESAGEGPMDFRPRLLHRLDKDTSGVLVAAKDLEAERLLRTAFEMGDVQKTYLALVEGEWPDEDELVLDGELGEEAELSRRERRARGKAGRRGHRMAVLPKGGKPAVTRVSVAERFRGFTMLCCRPETGRTHQIRVHLAHAGFPLAVDPLYGRRDELLLSELKRNYRSKPGRPERPLMDRLTLHAARIRLPDPAASTSASGGFLEIEAPVPADFQRITRQLAKVRPYKK